MQFSSELYGIFTFFSINLIAAILGLRMAWARGRNPLGWGLLCLLLPVVLLVIWSKPPVREVAGGFHHCPACGGWTTWKKRSCTYCAADFPEP
jgi:hypothetical protein